MSDYNSNLNFVERVSLAVREPVYSAAFAWVLEEASPLSLSQRLDLLKNLSGLTDADVADVATIKVDTEWNEIDLLATLQSKDVLPLIHIAIENKIKAAESSQQLARYDGVLRNFTNAGKLCRNLRKLYLTLGGEQPGSGERWQVVSYRQLYDGLSAQRSANPYLTDLCTALGRLIAVADAAENSPELASEAFKDDTANRSHLSPYMRKMRLEKVVQRIWMTSLLSKIQFPESWKMLLNETNGQASFSIYFEPQDMPNYIVGLQLQLRSLKAFAAPNPYPKQATKEQKDNVEVLLGQIKHRLKLEHWVAPSADRNRGFRSFTIAKIPSVHGRDTVKWASVIQPKVTEMHQAFGHASKAALIAAD